MRRIRGEILCRKKIKKTKIKTVAVEEDDVIGDYERIEKSGKSEERSNNTEIRKSTWKRS